MAEKMMLAFEHGGFRLTVRGYAENLFRLSDEIRRRISRGEQAWPDKALAFCDEFGIDDTEVRSLKGTSWSISVPESCVASDSMAER